MESDESLVMHVASMAVFNPLLPTARRRAARLEEVVRATPLELHPSQMTYAAEHRRDPPARPAHRVLDRREDSGLLRPGRQLVEQRAHEVAATVVEARDLPGLVHRVLGRVLGSDVG